MTKNLNQLSRVAIVGCSGAGKTSLARALSLTLELHEVELDGLFWKPNWTESESSEFRQRVENVLSSAEGWVVSGNYSKLQDLTIGGATHLIWLDYSRKVVFWRVFKRTLLRVFTRELLWATNRESFRLSFMSKNSIILYSMKTFSKRRKQYQSMVEKSEYPRLNIIHHKTPAETRSFLKNLKNISSRAPMNQIS